MADMFEFLKSCSKLYFGLNHREDGFDFIKTHILWFQPFLLHLFLAIWYYLISNKFSIFGMVGSLITFSISSVIAISIIHLIMITLGGVGNFREMFKFGLSIWIFPILINLILLSLLFFIKNQIVSYFFGIIMICVSIYTFLISILIYRKIQNLSTEYTVMALLVPFILLSGIIYLLNLSFN